MHELYTLAMVSRGWPVWLRYLLTTSAMLAVFAIRLATFEAMPEYPFLLFFPVIIVCGIALDRGNGIFATILGGLLAVYAFFPPVGLLTAHEPKDFIALALFIAVGIFTSILVETLHVAFVELAKSHAQLDRAAKQRELLLRELTHRMRNDLATIAALLTLQARAADNGDVKRALAGAADRVQVLARVHHRLSMRDAKAVVDSRQFIGDLCDDLRVSLLGLRSIVVRLDVESHPIDLERAVAVGLIINELLTNALKYAFPDEHPQGQVSVELVKEDDRFRLTVSDTGVGFSELPKATGMGHNLVRMLSAQLGGQADVKAQKPGSIVVITFPAEHKL